MTRSIRRLVTGHDKEGKSILVSDAPAHNKIVPLPTAPDLALINLWQTDTMPVTIRANEDPTSQTMGLTPTTNGSIFRVVDLPPDASYLPQISAKQTEKAWEAMQAEHFADALEKAPHPLMHCTPTIDYAIVLEGEIYLILDKSEHLMKAGDVAIQCATNHAWSNRTDKMCRIAFILIDAKQ
ncbi:MAG: cupin domain-containing protein [Gammaproteobacteria bacterium]